MPSLLRRTQCILPAVQPGSETQRKRILSIDGGGVRGVFSLEILERMESALRNHAGKRDLVLADHFHFIAGTSTGGIIATFLSWGMSAAELKQLYIDQSTSVFQRAPWHAWRRSKYVSAGISSFLKSFFVEDDGSPALLGTAKLRTLLLLVLRNASTASTWPLTNNPNAKFNANPNLPDGRLNPDCNLNLPLWQLVRGSTAAPFYFPPERIRVGVREIEFVDGGLTPYNNPAVIAYLTATQPCYAVNWVAGAERLHLVSVGNVRIRSKINPRLRRSVDILPRLQNVPAALSESINLEQDLICRVLGACIFGEEIDREIGDLRLPFELAAKDQQFTYVRYDERFGNAERRRARSEYGCSLQMDQVRLIPFLLERGKAYAERHVRIEHLL